MISLVVQIGISVSVCFVLLTHYAPQQEALWPYVFAVIALIVTLQQALELKNLLLVRRMLKEKGWALPFRFILIESHLLSIKNVRRLVALEEYRSTPQYDSTLTESENLIETLKWIKKSSRS